MIIPEMEVIKIPSASAFFARLWRFAPAFCAQKVEIEESILEGIKNIIEIIFSTIPTAAAISIPRPFAIFVIIMKEI